VNKGHLGSANLTPTPFDLASFPEDGHSEWPSSLHGLDDLQTSGVADLEGIEALCGFSGV